VEDRQTRQVWLPTGEKTQGFSRVDRRMSPESRRQFVNCIWQIGHCCKKPVENLPNRTLEALPLKARKRLHQLFHVADVGIEYHGARRLVGQGEQFTLGGLAQMPFPVAQPT